MRMEMKMRKRFMLLLPMLLLPLALSACRAEEDLGAVLSEAAFNTLIGMGTVFVVLILISFIIWLFKFIGLAEKKAAARKQKQEETKKTVEAPAVPKTPEEALPDDRELVAVIAAAVAAYEGTSADGIVVRSIRRLNDQKTGRRGYVR